MSTGMLSANPGIAVVHTQFGNDYLLAVMGMFISFGVYEKHPKEWSAGVK